MKFNVSLVGKARVTTVREVEANSEEEAREKATENVGDCEWRYEGLLEGEDVSVDHVYPEGDRTF